MPATRVKRPPVAVPLLLKRLKRAYPGARCSLDYENAFQLLVATILAAQSTDVRVNIVSPDLFERWPDAKAIADADRPRSRRRSIPPASSA